MAIENKSLVVTLGGQAQVVTFALDYLLAQGESINELIVVHLDPAQARVRQAREQISRELTNDCYNLTGQPLHLRFLTLMNGETPLTDIRNEADAEATWQAMYALMAELKTQGRTLHVCLAGGRRIMGLMAMSASMLLFDHRDRLWHLYTPEDLRRRAFVGALMHTEPHAGVRLIQVPMAPWGAYFPGLQALRGLSSMRVMANQRAWLESEEQARCQRIVQQLSERQREVLRAFARGLRPQQVAEQLNITLKTVDSHKTIILDLCRNEWQTPDDIRFDYHFLREKFRHWADLNTT